MIIAFNDILNLITKTDENYDKKSLIGVRFVPLVKD